MDPEEFTPQQYKKFNGQSIMLALENMGGSATTDDLAQHIGMMIDQSESVVKPEVQQVLRRGIANGFLQRHGKKYFLFRGSSYEVDGKRKRKTMLTKTGVTKKRIRLLQRNDMDIKEDVDDEMDSDIELENQNIEGLQEIISKANEDSKKATLLATKAVKMAKLASMKIVELAKNAESESVE